MEPITRPLDVDKEPILATPKFQRFLFIDALRGIAAFMVMCHHWFLYFMTPNGFASTAFVFGARGVQVFLIVSGFVIAFSLKNIELNARLFWNFIFRRLIRLTPVYWCAIAVTAGVSYYSVKSGTRGCEAYLQTMYSWKEILINGLYLQTILGARWISGPAWVLCLEIQFYFVYAAALWIVAIIFKSRHPGERNRKMAMVIFFGGILCACFFKDAHFNQPYVFPFLSYFAFGALIYCAMAGWVSYPAVLVFPGMFAVLVVSKLLFRHSVAWFNTFSVTPNNAVCMGAVWGLLILAVGYFGKMEEWSGGRLLQYMGRISYSFYLIHMPVLWAVHLLVVKKFGFYPNTPFKFILLFSIAALACILVAEILYRLVERPTMRLAAYMKLPSKTV